jgi:hypothetical protein
MEDTLRVCTKFSSKNMRPTMKKKLIRGKTNHLDVEEMVPTQATSQISHTKYKNLVHGCLDE